MMIEDLPEIILEQHVFCYLTLVERCRLLGLNRRLWGIKQDYEKRIRTLTIHCEKDAGFVMVEDDTRPQVLPLTTTTTTTTTKTTSSSSSPSSLSQKKRMYQNLSTSLLTLDLTCYCTDGFLRLITEASLFPLLKNIRMKRSTNVTDYGLEWLSRHNNINNYGTGAGDDNKTSIEIIDITFCSKTTYGGTFCLRDRLSNSLRLLRRQPEWLDGKFHTPFNNNESEIDGEVEVHTYYPDGTFTFNRENQSRGFVSELIEWDENGRYLADKLQYSNFEPLVGWPTWTTYSYRPGVCLFKLPDTTTTTTNTTIAEKKKEEAEDDNNNDGNNNNTTVIRTVLVGQNLRGLRPPKIRHLMEENADSESLKIGTSTYYTKDPNHDDDDDSNNSNTNKYIRSDSRPPSGGIMISKMRVYPLDTLLPPNDLVEECRTACEVMKDLGEDVVNSGENYLNEALNS